MPMLRATTSPSHRRLVEALKLYGDMNKNQLSEKAHVSMRSLMSCGYMERLVAAEEVHIVSWERQRTGKPVPTYRAGKGKNAPRPEAIPPKEKHASYRQGETYRKMRARRKGIKEPLVKDQLMNVLFGARA